MTSFLLVLSLYAVCICSYALANVWTKNNVATIKMVSHKTSHIIEESISFMVIVRKKRKKFYNHAWFIFQTKPIKNFLCIIFIQKVFWSLSIDNKKQGKIVIVTPLHACNTKNLENIFMNIFTGDQIPLYVLAVYSTKQSFVKYPCVYFLPPGI